MMQHAHPPMQPSYDIACMTHPQQWSTHTVWAEAMKHRSFDWIDKPQADVIRSIPYGIGKISILDANLGRFTLISPTSVQTSAGMESGLPCHLQHDLFYSIPHPGLILSVVSECH